MNGKNFFLLLPRGAKIGNVFLYGSTGPPKIPVAGDWKGSMEKRNFFIAGEGDEIPDSSIPLGGYREYSLWEVKRGEEFIDLTP